MESNLKQSVDRMDVIYGFILVSTGFFTTQSAF